MKILIIRFSSIGDIVLTTPVVRAVKMQLNAEVHYATKIQFKGIVETNPHIDRLHFLEHSLQGLIGDLKKEKFDVVIDLHNNLRTRFVKLALGVKSFSFRKLNIQKWLIVNFKINVLPAIHIVDRYLETVASLGVKDDELGLDYFIPDRDVVAASAIPESHRAGYVAYAIGGQHATKKLPVDRMIELVQKINRPVILLGGKEDVSAGKQVEDYFKDNKTGNTVIYNACGLYNLNQSASLVARATSVFSHDTGLMHIAAALGKEVYSIWGNTIPAFGMTPYRTKTVILENEALSCRPCSKIGFEACPKGHFKCMKELPLNF